MHLSKRAKQCQQSPMRKFHPYAVAAQNRGIKIHHLNIGQPDIPTPEEYFKAMRLADDPVVEYAPSPGVTSLIDAVIGYYSKLGVKYDPCDVLITTGGSEALSFLMMCILDEGDEVIVFEPFYPNYDIFVRSAGGRLRPYVTSPEDGYRFTSKERLESLINERTRAIMVTNPSNPTGVVFTEEEMRILADVAKEHGLYLISDEVYREFIYSDKPMSTAGTLEGMDQNVVLIDSVSKRFSACGARIGMLISKNKPLMEQVLKFCQGRLAVAVLDQIAAAALYSVGDDYFSGVREEYKRRRDTVYSKLQDIPGVVCKEPEGAFYVMAKLPVDSAEKFQLYLLEEFSDNGETVMFAPGGGFYATEGGGVDEIRIAYVLNTDDLSRAMDLLKIAIERYNS